MGAGRYTFRALCLVLLCGLSACFVPEAGDRSRSSARANPADSRLPEDVLKLPDMAQAFPGMAHAMGEACWYLPYAVIDEDQGLALVEALTALLLQGRPFPEKLEVAPGKGAGGTNLLHPLREGVARLYYSDINDSDGPAGTGATIPVIISQPEPGATEADVLYMDGHMKTVRLGQFPLSPGFLAALGALDPPEHMEKGGR